MMTLTEPGTKAVNCKRCGNKTCHYPCVVANDDDIINCYEMKNGYCSESGCHWREHNLCPYRYEIQEIEKQVTLEEEEEEV